MDRKRAEYFLKRALNDSSAKFHKGQWEAIDAVINQRQKRLVVQRTGWGKSSVYFISTRILRAQGYGPTLIISPLLSLMRNQIESAARFSLCAARISSDNRKSWPDILEKIEKNQLDCLLISPERLANQDFIAEVLPIIAPKTALLVIDEIHCVSDWGHDFRPDYRRIVHLVKDLPEDMAILGTTATANDRVLKDIQLQFPEMVVQRGSLLRKSLSLYTLIMPRRVERLAWLKEYLPGLPGTGIIYTLTIHDAETVSEWLNQHGIHAAAYHGQAKHPDFDDSTQYRHHLEQQLLNNQLKALVATTALGMGFDKPDLGFVIHYQAPNSLVAYYQQVGRAGRAIKSAVGILMWGEEDDDIHLFFRRHAFPTAREIGEVLIALERSRGLLSRQLEEYTNLNYKQIQKALRYLAAESPAPVKFSEGLWHREPGNYFLNQEHMHQILQQREREWLQIQDYLQTSHCLMHYLRLALDDDSEAVCGVCANCQKGSYLQKPPDAKAVDLALMHVRRTDRPIAVKKQVASGAFVKYNIEGNIDQLLRAEEGRVLSRWGDAGWGDLVAQGKHQNHFNHILVEAMVEMIRYRWMPYPEPQWVCAVPSLNHVDLVPDFAERLAAALELPFVGLIKKVEQNQPQKYQQNRFHQCRNLDGVFMINEKICSEAPVLLVDDMIDSGWTLAIIALLLRRAGSGPVFPVALASTAILKPLSVKER
ncbi:RecQ family ATP-dependent DNA helicase [Magnetococcales bacterium HHB-1]